MECHAGGRTHAWGTPESLAVLEDILVGDVGVRGVGDVRKLLDEAVNDDEAWEALLAAVLPGHGVAAETEREAEVDAALVDDPAQLGRVAGDSRKGSMRHPPSP